LEPYQSLPPNGRRIGDLLIRGGTVIIPGIPHYTADFVVSYEKPLLREGGRISDIGDLAEVQTMDTLDLSGLYLHPMEEALDRSGESVQIAPGSRAFFRVTRDRDGAQELYTFAGGPPSKMRKEDQGESPAAVQGGRSPEGG
jgi:hypothetical protein